MPEWSMVTVMLEQGEALEPSVLENLLIGFDLDLTKGVILDGRAPIWLHAHLIAKWHIASWIAVNDPKLGGAVVVKTHKPGVVVGSIQSTAFII